MLLFKSDKKYLFVFCYTPLHSLLINNILSNSIFDSYNIVRVCNYCNSENVISSYLSRVIQVLTFFYCRILSNIYSKTSILLPHPEHLLANYFFYSPNTENIYLYEDGLMNYLDVRLKGRSLERSKKRRFIAFALLYKYHIINGYLSGCTDRTISGTFVRFPKLIFMQEKHGILFRICTEHKNISKKHSDCALFIDQDIESQYGKEEAFRLRMKLYSKLSSFRKVYVKMHHDYLGEAFKLPDNAINFVMLPPDMQKTPAEQLIEKLEPGSVWGFYSSALVNIANDYKEIHCYSCIPEQHKVTTSFGCTSLSNLMNRFGVHSV